MAKTPITPNQLTTARLITGLVAVVMFALGDMVSIYMGCALFFLSMILDRADGILARLTGTASKWGHRYDLLSDSICNSLVFIGIGIGQNDEIIGQWGLLLGLFAGVAVAMVLLIVIRVEKSRGGRGAEIEGIKGFDPDDAMIAIPIALLLDWGHWLLIAAGIGTPVFLVFFFWKFRSSILQTK